MPIGKNAIKRVKNNGYSNVKTDAPDMLNSEVLADNAKPATVKNARKTTKPKTAPKAKKPAISVIVPTDEAVVEKVGKGGKSGFERVSFGEDMPYWLL